MLKKRVTILGKSVPILAPIAITLVVVAIALAAVLITVTQTITQKATVKPTPAPQDEIIAAALALPDVYVGDGFSWKATSPILVTTILGDRTLGVALTADENYTSFEVTLTCKASTGTACASLADAGVVTIAKGEAQKTLALPLAGTYTFEEVVTGNVGAADPGLTTDLTLTVED